MDELADLVHDLRLAALEVADEVPAERVAVSCVLGLEVLRAVLAHDLDSGLGQDGHVLDGDVLRRGDDVTSGPTSSRTRASRVAHLLSGQAPMTPCVPRGLPVRRSEKKRSGRQGVQRSRRSTLARSGVARRLLGRRPEVELAAARRCPGPKRSRKRLATSSPTS